MVFYYRYYWSADRNRKTEKILEWSQKKLVKNGYSEVSENIGQLKITVLDGKQRKTDCANTESLMFLDDEIERLKK
jgi:hypothetical protein